MKQNKLIYAFILLGITFLLIYVNKKLYLEGYTYNKDLTFKSSSPSSPPTGSLTNLGVPPNPPVHASTCKIQCDKYGGSYCTGFTSSIIDTPNDSGVGSCTMYNHIPSDTLHLDGTNLYLKN